MPDSAGGEPRLGILILPADEHFKMEVGPGGIAGAAHPADHLPLAHLFPRSHQEPGMVGVAGLYPPAVVDDHQQAVAAQGSAVGHGAGCGGPHGSTRGCRDVKAVVVPAPTGTEAGRDAPVQRPYELDLSAA